MNNVEFQFDAQGLLPAILQDYHTRQVLMLGYMNAEALKKTQETGKATFFSRSRQCLWTKGETSGNVQKVVAIDYDCDKDALLIQVIPEGPACHTGNKSCFYRNLMTDQQKTDGNSDIIKLLDKQIKERRANPVEGSYTNYLFREGVDKICKKIGEESTETVIAAKNNSKEELIYEASDLLYHLTVLFNQQGVEWDEVYKELTKRHMHQRKREY